MGWGQKCHKKSPPPIFFWSKIMKLFSSDFEPKRCFSGPMGLFCVERSGTSVDASYSLFSLFCYIGGFGDLGEPVVPTLRNASRDVVIVMPTRIQSDVFYCL